MDHQIDPELASLLAEFAGFDLSMESLTTIRAVELLPPGELSDLVERTDHVVPGDPDVLVRVHRPRDAEGPRPCIYSIHGGGYVMGSHVMDDMRFDHWCPRLGCVGVSVEYRLAPEAPFPGPLEDCYRGLRWVAEHAGELGVDRARLGVMGVSAGGGLAAGLALLARDRGEIALAFQLLECPMLDDRQVTPSSQLEDLPIWTRENNEFGWRCYLGDLYGTDEVPPYAAPARATDLGGLPPSFVSVGTADGFRDENIVHALRLNQAGVPTELHVYPGAPHGFQLVPSTGLARRANRDVEDWLGRQLGRPVDGRG